MEAISKSFQANIEVRDFLMSSKIHAMSSAVWNTFGQNDLGVLNALVSLDKRSPQCSDICIAFYLIAYYV